MDFFFTPPVIYIILGLAIIALFGLLWLKGSPFYPVHNDEEDERFDPEADMPVEGQRAILSVSSEDDRPAGPHDKIRVVSQSPDTAKYRCGHTGPAWYSISVYGDTDTRINSRDWCPDCFVALVQKYTTRCACCGLPIRPDDGVTFYHASSPRIAYKKGIYRVDDFYIGCMRDECRDPDKFLIGYWDGHDFRSASSTGQTIGWTTWTHEAVGNA